MNALLLDGPCEGTVDNDLPEPAPHMYLAATFHDDHLPDGLEIAPGQEIPTLRMEEHTYQVIERPNAQHYCLLAEREVPRSEHDKWVFYAHAPSSSAP